METYAPSRFPSRNLPKPLFHIFHLGAWKIADRPDPYARRKTKAEFLLPKAMQFATACSIWSRRPGAGT